MLKIEETKNEVHAFKHCMPDIKTGIWNSESLEPKSQSPW